MSRPPLFKFKLYTAGDTENSALAYANLLGICKAHLEDRYSIEVIDVVRHPRRALADGIRMTPTLTKWAPAPMRTIVGTLSQTERVLVALGIEHAAID
jgi:circadian clock protein KaiB